MTWRIKNWEKHQHYKDRNPPWIKLHREMLTSRTWVSLDNDGRALAIACMLIAADTGNEIPEDEGFIRRRAYFDNEPDFEALARVGFIERIENKGVADASKDASAAQASARPETETEAEAEAERETETEREKKTPTESRANQGSRDIYASPPGFKLWWSEHPRKKSKGDAHKAYTKATKTGLITELDILMAMRAAAAFWRENQTEDKFIPYPATWIRDHGWNDDLTVRRAPTPAEQLQEWVDGDEGDGGGSGTIDGDYIEVPEPRPEGDGDGVLSCAAGSERRGREAGHGGAAEQLGEDERAEASRLADNRQRVAALTAKAASATKAPAVPRGDHAQNQGGHLPCPGDPGVRCVGQAPEILDPGGEEESRGEAGGISPGAGVVGACDITPSGIDLAPPASLERRAGRVKG